MRQKPLPDSIEDLMSRGLTLWEAKAMVRAYQQALDLRVVDEHGNERTLGPGPPITEEPDQAADVNEEQAHQGGMTQQQPAKPSS